MLVINSNNTQDTTNYMVGGPEYPNVEQILMYGGPVFKYMGYNSNINVSIPVIKTIGSTNIHYFCPKIYRQGLLQGNFAQTNLLSTQIPDISYYLTTSTISVNAGVFNAFSYTIAVSNIPAGSVIGEHIFAPIGIYYGGGTTDQRCIGWESYTDNITIKFSLLHSDGTESEITTITTTYLGGMGYGRSKGRVVVINSLSIMGGTYNGVGQTAQEGDTLIATVSFPKFVVKDTAMPTGASFGITYGSTNNNNLFDYNGFRPFQVSIRDA